MTKTGMAHLEGRGQQEGQQMAIDYEKEEQQERALDQSQNGALRDIVQAAGAAHRVAAIVGANDQLGSSGFGTASPLGAAIAIGESLEEGLVKASVDDRLERFPELKDVEVPVGVAARFPELNERVKQPDSAEIDEQEIA